MKEPYFLAAGINPLPISTLTRTKPLTLIGIKQLASPFSYSFVRFSVKDYTNLTKSL